MPVNRTVISMGTNGLPVGTAHTDFDPGEFNFQQAGREKLANIGISPAVQANTDKQDRFNQIFPWLQGQIGNGGMATAGGNSGQGPNITVGGVWNPQQIQQQVNSTRAQNDQAMQSQNRQQRQTTAGQGFGSNSPILQALQGQNFASNLATNTMAEQELRTKAAQQNQQATLQSQQAKEAQFASRQREDIERRKPYWQQQSALISALGGLV